MKRRALALCAGILLLGLLPGATLAGNPTPPSNAANLDQWNNPDTVNFNGENGTYPSGQPFSFGQTFTAGKTGMLSEVALNLGVDSADNFTVDIYNVDQSTGLPTGPSLASTSASLSDVALSIWVYFSFPVPLSVTKNAQYAIVFSTGDNAEAYGSSDTYAGGQALTDKGGGVGFHGRLGVDSRRLRLHDVRGHSHDHGPMGPDNRYGWYDHAADPHCNDDIRQRQ